MHDSWLITSYCSNLISSTEIHHHTCISAIIRKQVKPSDGHIPQAMMEQVEQKCMQSVEKSGKEWQSLMTIIEQHHRL
jgi:hypothetical protein